MWYTGKGLGKKESKKNVSLISSLFPPVFLDFLKEYRLSSSYRRAVGGRGVGGGGDLLEGNHKERDRRGKGD